MQSLSIQALRSFSGVGAVKPWQTQTALLLIDMQGSCIWSSGYTIRRLRAVGLDEAANQYERQVQVVVPNLARALDKARQAGLSIFHTHVVTVPGRGPGGQIKPGRQVAADSPDASIIDELKPKPGEFVLAKSCSGVFAGTNLDFLLRRLGIEGLIIGGVVTNGCVEHAVTHGHDLGYSCVLLSDGCAALTDEIHEDALQRLTHRRAHIYSVDNLLTTKEIPATADQMTAAP